MCRATTHGVPLKKAGVRDLLARLAGELGLHGEEARRLSDLLSSLLLRDRLTYTEALELAGEDALLLASDLGLVVPVRPDSRCLEWDSSPLAPGSEIRLNRAVRAVLEALLKGREGQEGLRALFSELGLDEARAGELARISLALAARRTITGSDIAAACRSHGLGGLENLCVAVLKAAEVISPILSSTWPSGDARYRTCRFLGLLTGL